MDGDALDNDAGFNGNEPGRDKSGGNPQSQLEAKILENARVEEQDGVFGQDNGDGVEHLVDVADFFVSISRPV